MRYILYHASCADGFAAAYIARSVYPIDSIFIPVQYGKLIPNMENNSNVIILDFSYSREELIKLADRMNYVLVIDHHKTAQKDLENLSHPNMNILFDMNESGATLTYKVLINSEVPDFYKYIRDRDLWLWEMPGSKEFSMWLASYNFDFDIWDKILLTPYELAIEEGQAILRYQNQQVTRAIYGVIFKNIEGYNVPTLNATNFISEIGHALCKKFPNCKFSATYFFNKEGNKVWSLRSIGDFDVSIVAKVLGGGGHKNAAGFHEVLK